MKVFLTKKYDVYTNTAWAETICKHAKHYSANERQSTKAVMQLK